MDEVEEFWCLGTGVPIRLDFRPVWQAARNVIPADQFIVEIPNGRVNLPNLLISVATLSRESAFPLSAVRGVVKVKFTMRQCSVIVTGAEFDPYVERR
jgi:hypothetical protein